MEESEWQESQFAAAASTLDTQIQLHMNKSLM